MAIIAMIMSVGMPAIRAVTSQQISSTARRFVGLIKSIRNDSILLTSVHRLAINFDEQTWYVEEQRKFELLDETPLADRDKKEEGVPSGFNISSKYGTEPKPVPGGVRFTGILTERDGYIDTGVAYVHFFPNGFTEQAILYLSKAGEEQIFYSLVLRPTGGRMDIKPGFVEGFQ